MAINATKVDETAVRGKKSTTLLRLFKYLLKYSGQIVIVLIVMAVSITVSLLNPLIIEYGVNGFVEKTKVSGDILKDPAAQSLIRLCIFAIIINIVNIIMVKIRMYLMARMSNDALVRIRTDLYVHIQKLGLKFFDSRPAGKIIARVISDVNSLKSVLTDVVTILFPKFATLIAVLVIMFAKNHVLAIASLLTVPFLAFVLLYIQHKCYGMWFFHRQKGSNLTGFIHEDMAGIKVIQSFAAEDETSATHNEFNRANQKSFIDVITINDAFMPIIFLSSGFATIALYFTSVRILGPEAAPIGTIIAFISYANMIWDPISQLGSLYNNLIKNIAGADRIFEIMDTKPEVENLPDAKPHDISGAVEFKNVSFAYDDDVTVLDNVSFTVKPGETIALVGPTGAGKSTIANLVSRFYDANSGTVMIDGADIKSITVESLRSQMGVMTQDNFLFTGTIRENIRYGKPGATEEEIINAAKAVHAHDFIMKLEKGYDTELSERGNGLSVGERQLLAFARTMVSMPKILILDEATSSIDTKTEQLVQSGIRKLLEGRTSFVIAHRLSTIKNADRIFVVNHGRITESGNHNELMQMKGEYYNLYTTQTA